MKKKKNRRSENYVEYTTVQQMKLCRSVISLLKLKSHIVLDCKEKKKTCVDTDTDQAPLRNFYIGNASRASLGGLRNGKFQVLKQKSPPLLFIRTDSCQGPDFK